MFVSSEQKKHGLVIYLPHDNSADTVLDSLICRLRAYRRQNHSDSDSLYTLIESTVLVYKDGSAINIGQQIMSKSANEYLKGGGAQ